MLDLDEQKLKLITFICAVWGSVVSTLLVLIKVWETFLKNRIQLETSYSFSNQEGSCDQITIENLSGVPVQVEQWQLEWRPRKLCFRMLTIDVTPSDVNSRFRINAYDNYTIIFEDDSKFDWSHRTARRRALFLTLHIFGRRRPKVLKVGAGQ